MKPISDMDYVEFYAQKLKDNNLYFKKQKELIESQMKASREIFRNGFGKGKVFRINAREYLKKLGALKEKS